MASRVFNTVLNIVPQQRLIVVQRMGKYLKTEQPGFFFAVPFIDQLYKVDMREAAYPIDPQKAVTKDNVQVTLAGNVYLRFDDAEKATYGAQDAVYNVISHAMSSMRSAVGGLPLDEVFHNRGALNASICDSMNEASKTWGCTVTRYEVTDILPDPRIQEAMDLQASAERRRREQIKEAEGDRESQILRSEGERMAAQNISEGHLIRVQNEAEAERTRLIKEAEGNASKIRAEAEARADALIAETNSRADALRRLALEFSESGVEFTPDDADKAMRMMLAEKWINEFGRLAEGSKNSLIVPTSAQDVSSVVATALDVTRRV